MDLLKDKVFSEVMFSCDGVIGEVFGLTFEDEFTFVEEVSVIDDVEGLSHIVVCDEDGKAVVVP